MQDYLFEDDNVFYVGYDVPHPLNPVLLIRMGLNKYNTITENNNVMIKTAHMLIGYITEIEAEWDTLE